MCGLYWLMGVEMLVQEACEAIDHAGISRETFGIGQMLQQDDISLGR
jgi:hypothetical protein